MVVNDISEGVLPEEVKREPLSINLHVIYHTFICSFPPLVYENDQLSVVSKMEVQSIPKACFLATFLYDFRRTRFSELFRTSKHRNIPERNDTF